MTEYEAVPDAPLDQPLMRPAVRKRIASGARSRERRDALDAELGKVRHGVLDRHGATPIQRGELVRLKGYGTQRRMRFMEYVERPDDPERSYVTVLDTVPGERERTGAYISVRPDQVVRVRRQQL